MKTRNSALTPTSWKARWAIAPVALSGLAMLVAACGSPAAPSSASSSPASSAASSAAPGASASTGSDNTGSGNTGSGATSAPTGGASMAAAAGGPAACQTSALALRTGASQGAAGSTFTELDFTNISHAACTLYGYPGVSFTGGAAHTTQIGVAATESASPPRQLVTLAPGAVAGALLRIVDARNFAIAACNTVTAHYLRVYPPNQRTPLYVGLTAPTCSNTVQILTVSVVRAGAGNAS